MKKQIYFAGVLFIIVIAVWLVLDKAQTKEHKIVTVPKAAETLSKTQKAQLDNPPLILRSLRYKRKKQHLQRVSKEPSLLNHSTPKHLKYVLKKRVKLSLLVPLATSKVHSKK